ncbi:hypothetical protein HY78_14640 [Rhizorhabdus wittichii DC-6]|nr:hypothetical protein HY78_14640 [Rhizorhabdus wittichii DC-6]
MTARRDRIRRGAAIIANMRTSQIRLANAGLHRRARMVRAEIARSFDREAEDAQLDRWAERARRIELDAFRAIRAATR